MEVQYPNTEQVAQQTQHMHHQHASQPQQTVHQVPQERIPEQPMFSCFQEVPQILTKQFAGGACYLAKASKNCKIHLHFDRIEQQSANSIQELFTKHNLQAADLAFTISNEYMSEQVKKMFKNVANLHLFLANHIGSPKVDISRERIRLILGEDRQIDINIEEQMFLQKERNKVCVEMDGIEDKLLLFGQREWEELRFAYEGLNDPGNRLIDQKQFQGIACQESERDQEAIQKFLKQEQERIQAFDKQFAQILNLNSKQTAYTMPTAVNKPYQAPPKVYPAATPAPQLFPPGYTPPHLIKPVAPDGFAPEEHLRLHANQTKKEKLRMSKQMLKMGYSVDEVIQRLQEIQRNQKSGKAQNKNVYVAPSQGPVRPFHIPREQPHSMNFNASRNVPNPRQGNERIVRERLIALLREKRYKKLEDIQKHMAGEGIETTVEILKGMIDEIRAKNAQKRAQTQEH